MATNKKPTAKITADRAAQLKRTQVRAGKSKSTMAERVKQNAGVKDGTIRIGKSGKSYNIYDAKTGTWKRGQVVGAKSKAPVKASGYTGSGSKGGSTSGGDFERWFKQTYPGVPYPKKK